MVKVSTRDALAILRRFDQAGDEQVPRQIERLAITHPTEVSTLASFRFLGELWYVLFDDTADDDQEFIRAQIQSVDGEVSGELIENPHADDGILALPFKGKSVYLFRAIPAERRLDVVLAERYPERSRSTWQKDIKAGHVTVNGGSAQSPKQPVTEADDIAVALPPTTDYSEHELPIVYLDDDVIVINKPIGVLTHSKGVLNDEFTVAEFFRRYTTWGLDTNRPGIIHRLDRDTSGVLIGARHAEAAHLLQKQFADRRAHKTYVAVLDGVPKASEAVIDLPIGRNPAAPSTFRVDANGKPAETRYKILQTDGQHSLVELRPRTGRTHQLRVHMAYLGTPIHGDRIYGRPADRLYLHAAKLEVTLPGGERRVFVAPIPDGFDSQTEEA